MVPITLTIDPCFYAYGSLGVYWYGLCIALALGVYVWLIKRDAYIRAHFADRVDQAVWWSLCAGIVGARLVHLITDGASYDQVGQYFLITQGGLSMWGGVIGVLCMAAYILYPYPFKWHIVDRFALYAPWLHAISRIGCLLAGCCHGIVSTGCVGIIYAHPASLAQVLNVPVVPTQLLSSLIYAILGICMWRLRYALVKVSGLILCVYVMGVAFERWMIDWWRYDRVMVVPALGFVHEYISFHQAISMLVMLVVLGIMWYMVRRARSPREAA